MLDAMRPEEGGELAGHALQRRFLCPLRQLDPLPVAHYLPRIFHLRILEHMRVATHQFRGFLADNVRDREPLVSLGNHAMKRHMQQQIAQFLAQPVPIPFVDRRKGFVGLLDQQVFDGFVGLLPIPGAIPPQLPDNGGKCGIRRLLFFSRCKRRIDHVVVRMVLRGT